MTARTSPSSPTPSTPSTPSAKPRRIGRVLWPVGWVVLALGSGTVSYLLLVIVGR